MLKQKTPRKDLHYFARDWGSSCPSIAGKEPCGQLPSSSPIARPCMHKTRARVKKSTNFWKREVIFDFFNRRERNCLLCGAEIHHFKGFTEVGGGIWRGSSQKNIRLLTNILRSMIIQIRQEPTPSPTRNVISKKSRSPRETLYPFYLGSHSFSLSY